MKTSIILLRGVMPKGRYRVPMADLRAALTTAGLADVRTYIQSGNVVAKTDLARGPLEKLVHDVIAGDIGADIAVMARTPRQIRDILAGNPFPPDAAPRTYFTMLASRPKSALVEALLATDFTPNEVRLIGSTLYTMYATRVSDSKFTNNFFERKLKVAATTRNFNTMTRLLDMGT